jgi:uncharacterized Zn ribbon protein
MTNRPLVYYWEAVYNDGTVLSQYDNNYNVHTFNEILQDKLDKLFLKPFNSEMEKGLNDKEILVKSIPFLPTFSVSMIDKRRPIYYRDVYISHEEFHMCKECNKEFVYNSEIVETGGKYSSPICPNCGSYDYFYCKKCNKRYLFNETNHGMCPKCRNYLERRKITSGKYSRERRWIEYIIGAQQTINRRNTQFKLRIDEYGNCNVE